MPYSQTLDYDGETFQGQKSFTALAPGACIIKLITAVIYGLRNELECLSLAGFSSLF